MFYHPDAIDFGRPEVLKNLFESNISLLVSRQVGNNFRHAFVTNKINNFNNIDTAGRFGSGYNFPLYLYPTISKTDLFHEHETGERTPNIARRVFDGLTMAYGKTPSSENILHYIYAVLYAPAYRETYAECLKIDFPRIPFTADRELFGELAGLGRRLSGLHLLESDELDPPSARFMGEGDGRVAKNKAKGFRYDQEEERVWINPGQYFGPVPPEVWEYRVGGYQVPEKWLKDRKERILSLEEIRTYCRIVTALGRTIEIQRAIDELYPAVEEDTAEV